MLDVRDWLFLVIVFAANIIQGITGFAGTVLAMPPSMLLIGADDARLVLAVMALLSCAVIAAIARRYIVWAEMIRMVAVMVVGMAIGMVVYSVAPLNILRRIYGVAIIAIAVAGLCGHSRHNLPKPLLNAVLVGAGIIHGMFVSGGALLVVYASQVIPDKERFRATVSAVWVPLNLVMIVPAVLSGEMGMRIVALSAAGLLPLMVAVVVGGILARRLDQRRFMTLTYLLLAVSGLSVVW